MSVSQPYDFLVQWHLTERCNLRCKHCYQEGGRTAELSLGQIYQIIDEIRATIRGWEQAYGLEFSPSFNVTGGEPFLRPDFFTILEKMAATGFEIYILSNGTAITPEQADRLAALQVQGVQVSLEGPEEIHEAIRGKGSFAAAAAGVQTLLAAGLTVSLNATISRLNAGCFPDLVDIATKLKVPRLGFSRLVPSGRGQGMADQMLTTAEVEGFYTAALAVRVPGLKITSGDPLTAQMGQPAPEEASDFPAGGCSAGVAALTILPDGTVTPCRRLNIPLGKAGRDSLRSIWAASPVLEALRDKSRYHGKCGSCSRWSGCRGCRALAYASAAARGKPDFLASDPQCFIDADDL